MNLLKFLGYGLKYDQWISIIKAVKGMAKVDRSILLANDQQMGQFGDPDKIESSISHLSDVIDSNDNGFSSHKAATTLDHPDKSVTETKLADDSVSRRTIQTGAVGKDELDPTLWEQTAVEAKFQEVDSQLAQNTSQMNKQISTLSKIVDKTFFGMHYNKPIVGDSPQTPWIDWGHGSMRLWDVGINWIQIEPTQGNFDWTRFDTLVAYAESHNLELLMTLGQPPKWATGGLQNLDYGATYNGYPPVDNQYWIDYLNAVGNRYKGKIKYYEVWNEATQTGNFFKGTSEQLVTLTRLANQTLKAIDPEIKILSPSFVGINKIATDFDSFLAAGGGNYIDIVAYHLYCYPFSPEYVINEVSLIKKQLAKYNIDSLPVWNTEQNWLNYKDNDGVIKTTNMPPDMQSAYLFRMFLTNLAAGIERCFFYGQSMNLSIEILDSSGNVLQPGLAFQMLTKWLIGSRLIEFNKITDNNGYAVTIEMANGDKAIFIWTDDNNYLPVSLPYELGASSIVPLNSYSSTAQAITGGGFVANYIPTFVKFGQKNQKSNSIFEVLKDVPLKKHLLYNWDLKIPAVSGSANTPQGWYVSGTRSAYTGTDIPANMVGLTIQPTAAYQQINQYIRKSLKRGRRYQIGITYKLPVAQNNEWYWAIQDGLGIILNSDSSGYLTQSNGFTTFIKEIVYEPTDRSFPNEMIFVVQNNATSAWNPITVTQLWLKEIYGEVDDFRIYNSIDVDNYPAAGTYNKDQIIRFNTTSTIQANGYGLVCTQGGTFGTLSGITTNTTTGSNQVTVNTANSLQPGQYVVFSGDSTVYNVISQVDSTNYKINPSATQTLSSATVSYSAPILQPIGGMIPRVGGLPTASSSYRGQMRMVSGNGTSTADIVYMCLMSSTGTYSWKQITTG